MWHHFATPAAALRYIKSEGAPSNLQQVQIECVAKNSKARNGFEFSVEAPKAPPKPARTTAYTPSVRVAAASYAGSLLHAPSVNGGCMSSASLL